MMLMRKAIATALLAGMMMGIATEAVAQSSAQNTCLRVTCNNEGTTVKSEKDKYGRSVFYVFAPKKYLDSDPVYVIVEELAGGTLFLDDKRASSYSQAILMSGSGGTVKWNNEWKSSYKSISYRVENVKMKEDDHHGMIYYYNYYIRPDVLGADSPTITVPMGQQVKYTVHSCKPDKESDWGVTSGGKTDTSQKGKTEIIFNRTGWKVSDWFIPNKNVPKHGSYAIEAKEIEFGVKSPQKLIDNGVMTVARTHFKKGAHEWGFDNYTTWEQDFGAEDYYKTKNGRCKLAYFSVPTGVQGKTVRESTTADITFSFEPSGLSQFSPPTAKGSSIPVTFTTASEGSLAARYQGQEFAQLTVVPFKPQTRKVLVVFVGDADVLSILSTSPAINLDELNKVFKQCVTTFTMQRTTFDYSLPRRKGNRWSRDDLYNLIEKFLEDDNRRKKVEEHHHVVFVIYGWDGQAKGILGRGQWLQDDAKFAWIYHHASSPTTFAHEIGHNLGLGEKYNTKTRKAGPDEENVMNNLDGDQLRYEQWKQVKRL